MKKRTLTWIAILVIFTIVLVMLDVLLDLEIFFNPRLLILIVLALAALYGLYRWTSHLSVWKLKPKNVVFMGLGAALYMLLSFLFNRLLNFSFGPLVLRPALCIPILFGFIFGPAVGFFVGAVGSLLGDFVAGWDIFPLWNIAAGVMGMLPGFASRWEQEEHLRTLTRGVMTLLAVSAMIVLLHPDVPAPWTDEVQDYSRWGWLLFLDGLLLLANDYLLRKRSLKWTMINLWGASSILVSTLFASLADIVLNGFGPGTALVGEFAPSAAADLLSLMLFTPLVLAGYQAVQRYLPQ